MILHRSLTFFEIASIFLASSQLFNILLSFLKVFVFLLRLIGDFCGIIKSLCLTFNTGFYELLIICAELCR